jgi:threonine dehydrogenase-like Zn-dependent dehydrogenase
MHALSRVPDAPDGIVLLGYGPVGALLHIEAVRRWPGVPVEVVEPLAERRELAGALGALAVPPGCGAGRRALVVDAAGHPGSLTDAVARCANGGTVLAVALGKAVVEVLPAELTERALTLVGSNGFDDELPGAVALLDADPDRYRPVITEALLLDEAVERLPLLADEPATGKVVISPCGS